jgi:hypothetical protein
MTPSLQDWLSTATRGLCDYAVQRIRAEITDHYSAAIDAGQTPEAALASLGSPKKASRKYRKVYPTPNDLLVAGDPAFVWLEYIASAILVILPMQAAMSIKSSPSWGGPFSPVDHGIVLVLSSIHLVFHSFFRPSSAQRARNYLWLSVAQVIVIGFFIGPRVVGTLFFLMFYFSIRMQCLQFHRRIGNTPRPKPDPPGEANSDQLTERDVLLLEDLRQPPNGDYYAPRVLTLLIGAVCTWYWPWIAGPLTLYVVYAFALPRLVAIDTPERGRLFRRSKRLLFAATAVLAVLFSLGTKYPAAAALILSVVLGAVAPPNSEHERLRRKVPVDQWPERLYR